MTTDFSFLKILAGSDSDQVANKLLLWLDEQCQANGLQPLPTEESAHCSIMLITSNSQWLHLGTMGHFLPENTDHFLPFAHLLSKQYPVIGFRGKDGGPYILRRFTNAKVTARYATFGNGQTFDSLASAEPWNPVLEDWQDLLADAEATTTFYQLLPAPRHPDTPPPIVTFDYFDLPEHFNRLFGWNPELNYAAIEFKPDGPAGRGDFYEAESGDYVDTERSLKIYVRHFAHPEGKGYDVWVK